MEHFQKAVSLGPDHAVAHANLTSAFLEKGKRSDPVRHARRAIELGFRQPGLYHIVEQDP